MQVFVLYLGSIEEAEIAFNISAIHEAKELAKRGMRITLTAKIRGIEREVNVMDIDLVRTLMRNADEYFRQLKADEDGLFYFRVFLNI